MTKAVRIALLNPNSSAETTRFMAAIAAERAPPAVTFVGITSADAPPIITDETALAAATMRVLETGLALAGAGYGAILVAGFGDPGVDLLRARLTLPVVGIAEAGMAAAAEGGRRFSIVTTTPDLRASIAARAAACGHAAHLASIRITPGDAVATMADPEGLERALLRIAREAIEIDGAEAILVGGGPLGLAARAIAPQLSVPSIEAVSAGVDRIVARLLRGSDRRRV